MKLTMDMHAPRCLAGIHSVSTAITLCSHANHPEIPSHTAIAIEPSHMGASGRHTPLATVDFILWFRPCRPNKVARLVVNESKGRRALSSTTAFVFTMRESGVRTLATHKLSGGDLFFQAVAHQVFSALESLTSVFGMGTGGPLRYCHQNSVVLRN